jgi:anaerobic magnesium-protoporphyrin IX monomethyl ester cyclase
MSDKIIDEMFVLNERHVLALCDLLIERDYGLNIWAYARVDTVKRHMLEKLRRAGIRWLALGIESGSAFVRDGARKAFDGQDIVSVVRDIQHAGINVIGNFIFGLPDDDHETMRETLDLAKLLNCEFANFYAAMAYPGSPLYDMAVAKGWALPDSWSGFSQHSYDSTPLPTEKLSAAEVLKFRDQAFHEYFQNKRYLDMMTQRFGWATREHIDEMAKGRLRRKLVEDMLAAE